MAWTTPRTWIAGEIVSAALMNTYIRDEFNALIALGVASTGLRLTEGSAPAGAAGEAWLYAKSADHNLYLKRNGGAEEALIPAGTVLQVVNAITTSAATSASNSYVDTNLTASLTVASTSNKVLVSIQQVFANSVSGDQTQAKLVRAAADIVDPFWDSGTFTSTLPYQAGLTYLDSPATAGSVAYKTQFKRASGSGGNVNAQLGSRRSFITLMEIKG